MSLYPPEYGFLAEYRGDSPAYDDFDQYLQLELANRKSGWAPQFGKTTRFDSDLDSFNYGYVLTGDVPAATSEHDAEDKVRKLIDDLHKRLEAMRPKSAKSLPKPHVKVWRWPRRGG